MKSILGEFSGGILRGKCLPSGSVAAVPPSSPVDKSFIVAAGVEYIGVQFGTIKSDLRQIGNQADCFYYSGHGSSSGQLIPGNPTDFSIDPSELQWDKDLNVAIIAGCAVLNIGNYDGNAVFLPGFGTLWPGQRWEKVGPEFLLGYRVSAPLDSQGSADIAVAYATNRGVKGDINAWMEANDNRAGHWACAIEKNRNFYYFHRTVRFGILGKWRLRVVPKSAW